MKTFMRKLQLSLKKEILITGYDREFYMFEDMSQTRGLDEDLNVIKLKLICIGSKLNYNNASDLVQFVGIPWCSFVDYQNNCNYFNNPVSSFISAINKNGYTWNETVFNEKDYSSEKIGPFKDDFLKFKKFKTTNFCPSKTLIWEIL